MHISDLMKTKRSTKRRVRTEVKATEVEDKVSGIVALILRYQISQGD